MISECRHIMPSGCKCKSPALRGTAFCYFHTSLRRFENTIGKKDEVLLLPSLEDTRGVQIALHQVLGGLASGNINPRHVSLYLRGLAIAARLATRTADVNTTESVHDLYYENNEALACKKDICEIPEDCLTCEKRDDCDDFADSDWEITETEAESAEPPENCEHDNEEDDDEEGEDFSGEVWNELKARVSRIDPAPRKPPAPQPASRPGPHSLATSLMPVNK